MIFSHFSTVHECDRWTADRLTDRHI